MLVFVKIQRCPLLEGECLEVGDAARVVVSQVYVLAVGPVDKSTGGSRCWDDSLQSRVQGYLNAPHNASSLTHVPSFRLQAGQETNRD
jgi:hypothetical protein